MLAESCRVPFKTSIPLKTNSFPEEKTLSIAELNREIVGGIYVKAMLKFKVALMCELPKSFKEKKQFKKECDIIDQYIGSEKAKNYRIGYSGNPKENFLKGISILKKLAPLLPAKEIGEAALYDVHSSEKDDDGQIMKFEKRYVTCRTRHGFLIQKESHFMKKRLSGLYLGDTFRPLCHYDKDKNCLFILGLELGLFNEEDTFNHDISILKPRKIYYRHPQRYYSPYEKGIAVTYPLAIPNRESSCYLAVKPYLRVLEKFYETFREVLENMNMMHHFPCDIQSPKSPFPCIYIPDGLEKGLHALVKTRNDVRRVGSGFNAVITFTYNIATKKTAVLRASKRFGHFEHRNTIHSMLADAPQYFLTAKSYSYLRSKGFRQITASEDNYKIVSIDRYIPNRDLYHHLHKKTLDEKQKLKLMIKIAETLVELHKRGLVHLDLKPENILLDGHNPILADFDDAARIGEETTLCGTLQYIAPEMLHCNNESRIIAHSSMDIWSFGIMTGDIIGIGGLSGLSNKIYDDLNKFFKQTDQYFLNSNERLNWMKDYFPYWNCPNHLHQISAECLDFNPLNRPSADEIVRRLELIYKKIYGSK